MPVRNQPHIVVSSAIPVGPIASLLLSASATPTPVMTDGDVLEANAAPGL